MKANKLNNLFVGYNEEENFRVLICAKDEEKALEIATDYAFISGFDGEWEISKFNDITQDFDCDCVLTDAD